MNTKEILLEQFTVAYDENSWFIALKNALVNLSVIDTGWKITNLENLIWDILAHLNYYNFACLERFKGVDCIYPKSR